MAGNNEPKTCFAECGRLREEKKILCETCWAQVSQGAKAQLIAAQGARGKNKQAWQRWADAVVGVISEVNCKSTAIKMFTAIATGSMPK